MSLMFHFVDTDAFLNIPFDVIPRFLVFTFGISVLSASTADSFNIFLQDKYVTSVTIRITPIANS